MANTQALTPIQAIHHDLQAMRTQFQSVLPPQITVDRFCRIVFTAVQTNPGLVEAGSRAVLAACMTAAQIGLLPDGREAALIAYRGKQGTTVSFQAMVSGLMKLVRNSGEISTWDLEVVRENDTFERNCGDNPSITHKPSLTNRGKIIGAYSIVTLKSGEKSREFMDIDQIEGIRARSRAKDSGPWVTDFEEMAKKTVVKRHYKRLPSSTDLDEAIAADNEAYEATTMVDPDVIELPKKKRIEAIVESKQIVEPETPHKREPGDESENDL